MARLVGICVILFVLAVGFLIVTAGADVAALFNALWSEPFLDKLAWAVIMLVPLVMIPAAVWLCDTLVRQRKAAAALELHSSMASARRQGRRRVTRSTPRRRFTILPVTIRKAILALFEQRLMGGRSASPTSSPDLEIKIADLQSRVDANPRSSNRR